jgi:hypothetical protein
MHSRIKQLEIAVNMSPIVISQHSKVFPQFKGKHKGETAVIVGTGPSLNYYEPINDALHVGINGAFLKEGVNLNYWFCTDQRYHCRLSELDLKNLQNADFVKFFGQAMDNMLRPIHFRQSIFISDSIIEQYKNSYKFYYSSLSFPSFNSELELAPLTILSASTVFSACSFILYTGVKKIYVVGCDCANTGYFNGEQNTGTPSDHFVKPWHTFKDFVVAYHPDVEFISINPVGLIGLFEDMYTTSYKNQEVQKINATT